VLWSDNYIELMPGESREITAQFTAPDELEQPAVLTVEGWNLPRMGTNLPTPRN